MQPEGAGLTDVTFLLGYLVAINALTFAAFVHDKRAARRGDWRIAERTLLLFALIGGTPAAYAARHFVRHKTRKQPFVSLLHLTVGLQLALIAALVFALLRPDLVAALFA